MAPPPPAATGGIVSGLLRLSIIIFTVILCSLFVSSTSSSSRRDGVGEDPKPTPWPEQFHSVLVVNYSGENQIINLWYDWPNGRNFNIIQHQLGTILYDLEWNNGTSFFYTLPPSPASASENEEVGSCRSASLEVGILRPNWLDGATYLGQQSMDGFLCNVWTKADFIWYYEDLLSRRPVFWRFYTGRAIHVMTFEVGAVLEDAKWQAPAYCFNSTINLKHKNTLTAPSAALESQTGAGMTLHVMTFEVGAVLEDSKWQAPAYCFDSAAYLNPRDTITAPVAALESMAVGGGLRRLLV